MTEPHRDFAAEAVAERHAQSAHAIATAFEALRVEIARHSPASRLQSIALTEIDKAEAVIEKLNRQAAST